jgi:hypothetical protein
MTKSYRTGFPWFRSDNLESKIENAKSVGVFAIALTFAFGGAVVPAQQPAKVPRIGYLTGSSLSAAAARNEAFLQGLRDLGYIEGKNIVIEWRVADGKRDRVPALRAGLLI